ncbi:hypothetical protein MA16_Dca028119 [Dendrobium catenatum]|uniref:Uncharacterized protein n=1 Tax=Dendrobium catenatum TaxID=906689 RepID=A0A2I0VAU9_9ASPA|nr:hypothetical protein MA16_Dca028119 [Dendrobium catenatum]
MQGKRRCDRGEKETQHVLKDILEKLVGERLRQAENLYEQFRRYFYGTPIIVAIFAIAGVLEQMKKRI